VTCRGGGCDGLAEFWDNTASQSSQVCIELTPAVLVLHVSVAILRFTVGSPGVHRFATGDVSRHSGVVLTKKGTGWPMDVVTDPRIVLCPVCGSGGAGLHHDNRCSLRYVCQQCLHDWQIDAAEEPPQADPLSGSSRAAAAASQPPPIRD
jgi:hypothetical protein